MIGVIYAIIGPDGRYIGRTIDPVEREAEHKAALLRGTHTSPRLQRAWKDTGGQLKWVILEYVRGSIKDLIAAERRHIDGCINLYNASRNAGGNNYAPKTIQQDYGQPFGSDPWDYIRQSRGPTDTRRRIARPR
jgi:hypothetical protein